MEPVLIPCPKCGKHLKLRDRALLGRKGKCPKCEHRFVLAEPEEVQLELADDEGPVVGTSPQWVPDSPATATAAGPVAAVGQAFQPASADRNSGPTPVVKTDETSAVGTARLRAARERRKSQMRTAAIVGGVSALIVGGLAIWAATRHREPNQKSPASERDSLIAQTQPTPTGSRAVTPPAPPRGEPIRLVNIPVGTRLIIHLRPAEIWSTTEQRYDVLACLGKPLGPWLNEKLEEVLQFKPEEVEEALICLFLDVKTEKPDYAVALRTVKPQKLSSFAERFGRPDREPGRVVYVRDPVGDKPGRATMVTDQKGQAFASAPLRFKQELVDRFQQATYADGGLDQLLKQTDRKRHLTLAFNPRDVGDFRDHFFPQNAHPALDQFLDTFNPGDIEAVAWSFHFGSKDYPDFFSEMILRTKTTISPRQLQVTMQDRFRKLPGRLAELIRLMRPNTVGERRLVARLPVMFEAFRVETVPTLGSERERYVKFTTALPRIAGPNLAAAGMLTLAMVRRTDFSKPPPVIAKKKLPKRVADRLSTKIEVEFNRKPLQEAFDYIGEEISVKTDIDGDALKDAAFTKNMPQTFKLGEVSGKRALYEIVKQYTGMALVVDESKKMMILTTEKFAKMKGQKIFDLNP